MGHPDGSITRIEVEFGVGTRNKVWSLAEDADVMLTRCFWRFVGQKTKSGLVSGDCVRFTMSKEDAEQLIQDLLKIDAELSLKESK